MRAVVFDRYGPPEVLRVEEVDRPVPKKDEVLVRVRASTVTRTDTGLRTAEYGLTRIGTGLFRPRRGLMGWELAGEVEAAGQAVTGFAVGDRVFGLQSASNADFVCVRDRGRIAHMPENLTFEEAAAVPDGGCTGHSFLRQVRLEKGQRILVYGASGAIGTASVQLARNLGADVTAVCDTKHVDAVRALGPDRVIDRMVEDFTEGGQTYDVILDAVGKLPAGRSRRFLKPGGIFMTAGSPDSLGRVVMLSLGSSFSKRRVRLGIARYRKEDLLFLKDLVDSGAYLPVIDRTYPLEDVVEAHRYVDTEQKLGNVVLTTEPDPR